MSETQVPAPNPGLFTGPTRLWTTCRDGQVLLRLSKHGPGHETPMTIPELFQESVQRFGSYPALAWKDGEKWETLNFYQYYQACRKAARALIKLGLQRFHGVGILGFNSVEWFIAALGAVLAGGLCVGIYATNSADACQYVISHAKVNVLLVENDQQLQKILSIPRSKLATLKAIIQYKPPLKERSNNLYSWLDFMELGNSIPDTQLDQVIKTQKANQCAVIIYTSGTVGLPKGVMLSHDNITWMAGAVVRDLELTATPEHQEVVVSYLPLSHIAAQMMDMWVPIKIGAVIYFAESDALKGTLVHTLKEIKPTIFLGVPRIWEKMHDTIKDNLAKASSLRKKAFTWAKDTGLKVNTKRMLGKRDLPLGYHMAKALVYSRVRSSLGLERCRAFLSGAAPLPESTSEFFLSLDIPIGEIYGLSESSGPHSMSTHISGLQRSSFLRRGPLLGQMKHFGRPLLTSAGPSEYTAGDAVSEPRFPHSCPPGSCGKIVSGCENMLVQQNKDGTGEVCMWGRHIFMGYLDREDTTRETIDEDGWLHSGDLGRVDNQGFLFITGRIKEILITAGGENVAPVPIENLVRERIPIISNAMLVGDRAKFLSILLTLKCEMDQASGAPLNRLSSEAINFCRSLGSQADTVTEIVRQQDPLIYEAIQQGIDAVNLEATSEAQRIHKWVILEKDFSIQGGELGPTTKMKRPFIAQKYKTQIENFYQ
uniref:long-chain-fatty-acid--CoA ligase ACSBG2 n=1 Tax=Ictidomys tridecemlineatus TaxID=43179 RepID=UPI001A9CCBF5|nr:long-chain-fatty-acid--CoA ligase ACSBG2 [Ictidomys tridecemlineatus]